MSTEFYTIRSSRVNIMFGSDMTLMFGFKCCYKQYPFRILIIYALVVSSLSSYVTLIAEGPMYYIDQQSRIMYNDFRIYENCIWNTLTNMLTG